MIQKLTRLFIYFLTANSSFTRNRSNIMDSFQNLSKLEAESIQKDSSAVAKAELEKSTLQASSTNVNKDMSTALGLVQNDLLESAEITKSDVEFGVMETVSLETSIQEKNLDIQTANAGSNDLSKYFNVNDINKEIKDKEGVNFFIALAENPEKIQQTSFPNIEQRNILDDKQNESYLEKNTVIPATEIPIDSGNCKDDPAPPLLKFFSDDKSGQDKDGKAFFDKIAEDKIVGALEIEQPTLKIPGLDNFLDSSNSSDIEDSWIPSDRTRQILVTLVTSKGQFIPDPNDLTMPGVIIEEEMEDPVKFLLMECNSPFAQQRKALTVNDVSEDENGLKKLMEGQCYHAAINLTKRLLTSCGQGPGKDGKPSTHTPFSLRIWYTRLALFIKLRKFSLAEVESAVFGVMDKPDLYYEFYPEIYRGRKGSMVPFALRLLLAELPQYQGNHQTALDNMYRILNIVQKMLNNVESGCAEDGSMIELSDQRKAASLEVWKRREKGVLFSILNCVLAQKDYILAVSIAKLLIEKSGKDTAHLHSALGRIYLQLGDVQSAESYFRKATTIAKDNSTDFRVEENINNALLAVACDENEKAFKYFEQANSFQPNAMLVNNMAVCKLYTGQLKESLRLLESAIQQSPSACLHDGLIFNVCTLYELESSRCPQKKLAMLELVSKYAGDSFNVNCLKIQTAKA
ncbi:trafficking protein particle complex subunit 12 isoform X1 [Parasteatoda tepidariorum]|uniref:trafficking protein particle complex subunit 12 isoform X1 n=2 Tax=Parasteatoda tepidariorum TaxID=114398 RepID=UPI001C718629|nr:trafficking protein particle complex subunit 12 isoform X1 [Parasteatoda tepidariorum]